MVDVSSSFGRAICEGVSRFAVERGGWLLLPYKAAQEPRVMADWLRANRVDGIISCVASREIFLFLRETGIPLVNVLLRDCGPGVTSVTSDSAGIGRLAVDFFRRSGFINFAFCGYSGLAFSELRGKAFSKSLATLGYTLHLPPGDERPCRAKFKYEQAYGADSDRHLGKWLRNLPKPVAILACNDVRGQQVVRVAQECGIAVPEELAVLGVDNDETSCRLCAPALSSIDPNCNGIGHAAAQALYKLKLGIVQAGTDIGVPPGGVIERQTTALAAVTDPIVAEALRIIRDRIREKMTPRKLSDALGCSGTKLDSLFRKNLGCSSAEVIARVRLKRLTEILQETDLPLKAIAAMFSFSSPIGLSMFIRRTTGITPLKLRQNARPVDGENGNSGRE